jgi:cytochrome c oxidase subunit 1
VSASEHTEATGTAAVPPKNYLNIETTVKSWLLTRDHKRIGLMFLVCVIGALFLGGVFAMAIRIELLTPDETVMSAQTYNRMFTLHGLVMIFLFMIPAIPSGFGNFVLPMMIGAEDVAFPRLNLASWYIYLAGAAFMLWGIIHGGADTGWTFYTPYSTTTFTKVVPILLGAFVIGFSSIATGINFIVTVHTMRGPGLTWNKLPLFVWSIYATSVIQVLATPVLGITVLLTAVEATFGFGIFDPAHGGDPVLFQHMFWFYSHPAVYIMVLPAMAVMSEIVPTFARKNIFGYKAIAYSSVGIALVGFFAWGHHLFVSGQSTFNAGVFGVISMLVGVFTAIKVFNWVGTLYKGKVRFSTPFAYFCGFIYLLVFGGMTGVALATVSLDVQWTDTYFVIAHFHFIMVGATLMAFLGALHYWFPKMFGRTYSEGWGLVSAALIILGFNATFIPQFLLGNMGMPRRYWSYPQEFQALNVASTAGASLLAFGFVIILIYLIVALTHGEKVGRNPWGSRGYEWDSPSPPPKNNFDKPQIFDHPPHDYDSEGNEAELQTEVHGGTEHGHADQDDHV